MNHLRRIFGSARDSVELGDTVIEVARRKIAISLILEPNIAILCCSQKIGHHRRKKVDDAGGEKNCPDDEICNLHYYYLLREKGPALQ